MKSEGNFKNRVIFGLLGVLLTLLILFFSTSPYLNFLFPVGLTLAICMAQWEFYYLVKNIQIEPDISFGIALTICYMAALGFQVIFYPYPQLVLLTLFVMMIVLFIKQMLQSKNAIKTISTTLFGFFYIAVPLSFLLLTFLYLEKETGQDGRFWILYLLCTVKLTDTGAYFIGKWLGKHQMSPYLSPKKTWEGFFGGVITGVVTSLAFSYFSQIYFSKAFILPLFPALILALLISSLAHFGDLAESLFKRDANVKDSNTLPGLGGMLDVMDSLVFTTPLMYIYVTMNQLV